MTYYAAGTLSEAGVLITASHKPARYNGIKLALPGATPLSIGDGLDVIGAYAQAWLDGRLGHLGIVQRGRVTNVDLLPSAAFLREPVDLRGVRRLRVVVDAGNGMAGHTVPALLADSPDSVEPLYFELDRAAAARVA
jgi:phosphomannomutase